MESSPEDLILGLEAFESGVCVIHLLVACDNA